MTSETTDAPGEEGKMEAKRSQLMVRARVVVVVVVVVVSPGPARSRVRVSRSVGTRPSDAR
jgi:hypothetical protein